MARISKGLLQGMQEFKESLDIIAFKVGLLIIDEQQRKDPLEAAASSALRAQQRVIMGAVSLEIPVFFIELNPTGDPDKTKPSRSRLRGLLPPGTTRMMKKHLNAFNDTALQSTLYANRIGALVIMGHETNCCVKATAVGGVYDTNPENRSPDGATQRGFYVLSCQQVLRDTEASWADEAMVQFYDRVD
jgi:hypothetical protein